MRLITGQRAGVQGERGSARHTRRQNASIRLQEACTVAEGLDTRHIFFKQSFFYSSDKDKEMKCEFVYNGNKN